MAPTSNDIAASLRQRAAIRRQIETRKSVQEGRADKIADLCDAAAAEIERLQEAAQEAVHRAVQADLKAAAAEARHKEDARLLDASYLSEVKRSNAAERDRDEARANEVRLDAALRDEVKRGEEWKARAERAEADAAKIDSLYRDEIRRATKAEAERDSARALLKEAREKVSSLYGWWTSTDLLARIDAEVK